MVMAVVAMSANTNGSHTSSYSSSSGYEVTVLGALSGGDGSGGSITNIEQQQQKYCRPRLKR